MGPGPGAFALREDDAGGLSVTEVEYFGTLSPVTRRAAAVAHRESLASKSVGKQAIYAWAQVAKVKHAAAIYGKSVRVIHDPVDGNPGHAEIRHFTDEDLDLLEHFATDVFHEYETVAEMNLPTR